MKNNLLSILGIILILFWILKFLINGMSHSFRELGANIDSIIGIAFGIYLVIKGQKNKTKQK